MVQRGLGWWAEGPQGGSRTQTRSRGSNRSRQWLSKNYRIIRGWGGSPSLIWVNKYSDYVFTYFKSFHYIEDDLCRSCWISSFRMILYQRYQYQFAVQTILSGTLCLCSIRPNASVQSAGVSVCRDLIGEMILWRRGEGSCTHWPQLTGRRGGIWTRTWWTWTITWYPWLSHLPEHEHEHEHDQKHERKHEYEREHEYEN